MEKTACFAYAAVFYVPFIPRATNAASIFDELHHEYKLQSQAKIGDNSVDV